MTLAEKIAKLKELEAKATPGPWEQWVERGNIFPGPSKENCSSRYSMPPNDVEQVATTGDAHENPNYLQDASLIAYLRNNARDIIDEQAARIAELEAELKQARCYHGDVTYRDETVGWVCDDCGKANLQ